MKDIKQKIEMAFAASGIADMNIITFKFNPNSVVLIIDSDNPFELNAIYKNTKKLVGNLPITLQRNMIVISDI